MKCLRMGVSPHLQHKRARAPVAAAAAFLPRRAAEHIEIVRICRQRKDLPCRVRQTAPGGRLCDDRHRRAHVNRAQQLPALRTDGQHPRIRRRAAVHAGGHAQCRAHRHTPDTCERVALGLCRRQHAVKRRLLVRGAVQAVAEPLGRAGQRIIDCLRQHPQP